MNEIERGMRAQEVIGNPVFKEAFAALKEQIAFERMKTSLKDTDMRERLWHREFLLDDFEKVFMYYIETGELSRKNLETKQKWIEKIGIKS